MHNRIGWTLTNYDILISLKDLQANFSFFLPLKVLKKWNVTMNQLFTTCVGTYTWTKKWTERYHIVIVLLAVSFFSQKRQSNCWLTWTRKSKNFPLAWHSFYHNDSLITRALILPNYLTWRNYRFYLWYVSF